MYVLNGLIPRLRMPYLDTHSSRTEGASLLHFDLMTVMSFAKLEDSFKMVAGRECMF